MDWNGFRGLRRPGWALMVLVSMLDRPPTILASTNISSNETLATFDSITNANAGPPVPFHSDLVKSMDEAPTIDIAPRRDPTGQEMPSPAPVRVDLKCFYVGTQLAGSSLTVTEVKTIITTVVDDKSSVETTMPRSEDGRSSQEPQPSQMNTTASITPPLDTTSLSSSGSVISQPPAFFPDPLLSPSPVPSTSFLSSTMAASDPAVLFTVSQTAVPVTTSSTSIDGQNLVFPTTGASQTPDSEQTLVIPVTDGPKVPFRVPVMAISEASKLDRPATEAGNNQQTNQYFPHSSALNKSTSTTEMARVSSLPWESAGYRKRPMDLRSVLALGMIVFLWGALGGH